MAEVADAVQPAFTSVAPADGLYDSITSAVIKGAGFRAGTRVRVAGVHVEPGELRAREAEQRALASDALAHFLLSQDIDTAPSPRALLDYSADRATDAVPTTKSEKKMN